MISRGVCVCVHAATFSHMITIVCLWMQYSMPRILSPTENDGAEEDEGELNRRQITQ